jgi:hypothetical protein
MQKPSTSEHPFREKTADALQFRNKQAGQQNMYVTAEGFAKTTMPVNKVAEKNSKKEKENSCSKQVKSSDKKKTEKWEINSNETVPIGPQKTKE